MVAITHHPNLTLVSPNPEADIKRAIELWEQANETLLDAARIFANVKEQTQRKFNKLLESTAVEKSQVSKLIKAVGLADEIPSSVVPKLGLPMLLQLGQLRNQAARDAIAHDDTQLLVALKIKELRLPAEPKQERPVRFVGKKGNGKLRIEVPSSPKAIELERDWVASGLPPVEWLSKRVAPASETPKQHQELIAVIEDEPTNELAVAHSELNSYIEVQFDRITDQEIAVESSSIAQPIVLEEAAQSIPDAHEEDRQGTDADNSDERLPAKQTLENSATPDYAKLSKSLLKAKKWEKVIQLVERDANILATATQQWSPEQKEILLNQIVSHLEANPKAIMSHEVDWLGMEFMEQIFPKLSFRVRDISEGLAAEWQISEFVEVLNFGQDDDEVWIFNVASHQRQIKAYSRDDFEVVNF